MQTKFLATIIIGLLIGSSCNRVQNQAGTNGIEIVGLGSPFRLQGDESKIILADYFLDPTRIDSIGAHNNFSFRLCPERNYVSITNQTNEVPALSAMEIWIAGEEYNIILQRGTKMPVTLSFDPQGIVYENVFITGGFNNWNRSATPLQKQDGIWKAEVNLNPGRYHYLIVADGREFTDPNNPTIESNNLGGYNSVLTVGDVSPELRPHLIPLSHNRNRVQVKITNPAEEVFVFWQNHQLQTGSIANTDYGIEITIPREARASERSFLRLWSHNSHGISNNLLIPLQNGRVVDQPAQLTRSDFEALVVYFMLIDRFKNGNPDNDQPINDADVLPPANYKGGDLAGISQKIEDGYFDRLGINGIWISPITQNPLEAYVEFPAPHRKYSGYHGYWPITLSTVDHRFGTSAELRQLISSAHGRNINMLLDYVSNHVHEKNQLIIDNPHWATDLVLPDGRKNIRLWDEHRLTTWFDTFLPSLDFNYPEVIEVMSDSAMFWIEEYGFDGFRHDATKHIPEDYWRVLTRKLKEQVKVDNRRIFQIGETFGSRELIGSYVGSGLLDGQFDFNLYWDLRNTMATDDVSFTQLQQSLYNTFNHYGTVHLMGNITGNHDMPRFISFAGYGLSFDEDAQEAGWARRIEVENPDGYLKLQLLTAFNMTIPGVPVIYYGDEIGMAGGGDPDSRRMMRFDNLNEHEQQTLAATTKLANLRRDNLSLVYGDFRTLFIDDRTWVYSRRYFGNIVVVALSKSPEPVTLTVALPDDMKEFSFMPQAGSGSSQVGNTLEFTLQPLSFEVFTVQP